MAIIQMKVSELGSRGEDVRTMLQPISKLEYGPAWERKSNPGGIIIAVHDGANPTSDYRNFRFSTFVHNFQAMYFELWRRTEENEQYWYLDKAYLSIYRLIDRQEKEFLCLHCDPNISKLEEQEKIRNRAGIHLNKKNLKQLNSEIEKLDNSDKEKYKKGPHLHIKAADDPLPHAHFALNLGNLDAVLESIESLSIAMRYGILMLKEEVLDIL